ncbi:gcn5-related n-acetyltransferase [Grosmannia clavigera kw1407]|uniref:Gcn5-related n-acetyltransferase n=1 Tax=Grosmannia clavigera (strain kw1407 / UAMH 11150) TaxID=655863 RepID=F0XDD5_GROCL|nr:gcn5-related n-acetyltransferase [Grosmannia clavigera kw1407]EFX04305.1 gcn5-related n-acetyltransferase [Grosmannia clavigera kw1407]
MILNQFARPAHEILTPRLVLRTPTFADVDAHYCHNSTPENFPFDVRDTELTPEKARSEIERIIDKTAAGRAALLFFALRDTGELIGHGGYNVFQLLDPAVYLGIENKQDEMSADSADTTTNIALAQKQYLADIGIMLDHKHWRKGFGLETLSAMVEYAQTELGCGLFRIETDLANEPWRALMRAAGLGACESMHKATYDKDLDVWVWKFDTTHWAQAKETIKAAGKWPL